MKGPSHLLYSLYERRLIRLLDADRFPRHVGIVLDGHRRYARESGLLSYTESYRAGMARFEDFLEWTGELGLPVITAWVLSRENLTRPESELAPYFDVLIELFKRLPEHAAAENLRIRFIGSLDLLPGELVEAAKAAEAACPDGPAISTSPWDTGADRRSLTPPRTSSAGWPRKGRSRRDGRPTSTPRVWRATCTRPIFPIPIFSSVPAASRVSRAFSCGSPPTPNSCSLTSTGRPFAGSTS